MRTGTKRLSATAAYPRAFARAIAHMHLDHNRQEVGRKYTTTILHCEIAPMHITYRFDVVPGSTRTPAEHRYDHQCSAEPRTLTNLLLPVLQHLEPQP